MRKLPCNKRDLCWVVWKDAVGSSTRGNLDTVGDTSLALMCNIGWVYNENAERVILAHGVGSTEELDYFAIPVGSIVERIYPFRPKPRKPKKPTDASS